MSNTHILSSSFNSLLASSVNDIKNSLKTLRTLHDRLRDIHHDEKQNEFMQLEYESNRMYNCLMQLLTLYKLDLSQFSPTIDEYAAADILEEITNQHDSLFSFGKVEFISQCDNDLFCYCDRMLISNALSTLVNNAQRYSRSKVLLSASQENDYVVFCIEDDGEGYPESLMSSEYEQLPQLDLTSGNTGLGLFFAEAVAQLHSQANKRGYIITDNNSQFGGARFKLYLP